MTTTVPSRPAPPVDLTETELYRGGFPHEIFTTLRREAPVTWQEFPDTYVDGEPEYVCPDANTPSTNPPTPRRGFGKVWCTQPGVRSKLGRSLGDEMGNDRTVQDFQGGSMALISEYSDAPLALYRDTGHWQLVK